MVSLGQELKRERELRGISLKEIADSSKISMKFLAALEEDRLDILPGEFFIKGIIRTYAKSIGLDEDYALNKYHEISLLQEEALQKVQKKGEIQPKISKKRKILLSLAIVFILLVSVILSFYFLSQPKEIAKPPEKTQIPVVSQEPEVILPPPPVAVPVVVEEEKEMNLEISFLQETWVKVYADGELKLNGIYQPGDNFQIKALKELVFYTGNAGGISCTINGKKAKPFGPSGTVLRNIRMTLENYNQFLLPEEETKKEEKENRP
jgi:transcriptional regulator with XRE-family HTH domain